MKQRKKKKGSTFVIVIVVMGIIFTTGTTILAVTANDYKMRINESKRLQNLYEADSGLDVVENIIIKTSQEAIKYADKEVKKEFTKLDSNNRSQDKVNELFRVKFYEFLNKKKIVNSKEVELLQYLIREKKYIKSILNNDELEYTSDGINENLEIDIPEGGYIINVENDKTNSINIEVRSTFESTEGELKNKKTVSTKYEVFAPEYNSQISAINIYPVFDGKAITADGNMKVESGNLLINGDIWIKGNSDLGNNPEYTFDKYNGGIKLENTKFNINGNIYTANTFHLKDKVKSESSVNGNIYAKNVYVGKEVNSITSDSNNISFEKDVIVNNDLALNATKSNVVIKNNFYGINDKTTELDTASKALNSSSIIVNDTSGNSAITVENDSYIMGVAYLNATDEDGNKYQTGESVAVKGNYLAYTDVGDILNGENNITLKYYNPLQLLESKNGKSDAATKADYFKEYYSDENQDKKYTFNNGGVALRKKIYSVGASVKGDKVQGATIKVEDSNIVNEQRNEFARNVFAMGDATGIIDDKEIAINIGQIYINQAVVRTVSDQIDFNKVKNIKAENTKDGNGKVILIGSNENIVIEDNKINGQVVSKGLIITNGNITIKGNFNFTGNIITTGNINFEGEGEKNITYDPQVVRSILSLNYELLKDIFKSSASKGEEIRITSTSELYSTEKFLKKSLWRIVK